MMDLSLVVQTEAWKESRMGAVRVSERVRLMAAGMAVQL